MANSLLKENRNDYRVLNIRAKIYRRMNKLELALTDYNNAITLDSDNSELYLEKVLVLSKTGNTKEACKQLRKSIDLNEYCYMTNRRYFGEELFNRLLIVSVTHTWKT